jgi:hypothetical protein
VDGICGGPVVCSVSTTSNQCDVCLAEQCCTQLSACTGNTTCEQSQTCFDGCYAGPGTGATCAEKCTSEYPSTQGSALAQCAASSCLSACQ